MQQATLEQIDYRSMLANIRSTLRLSQEGLARTLGVSLRTIVRWEKEGDVPPPLEGERLDLIDALLEISREIMEEKAVAAWFSGPKESLSGKKPLDLISSFKGIQQVRELLEKTRWGIF